jgi:hypothetical protein
VKQVACILGIDVAKSYEFVEITQIGKIDNVGKLSGPVTHKLGNSWASIGAYCGGLVPPWGGHGGSLGCIGSLPFS